MFCRVSPSLHWFRDWLLLNTSKRVFTPSINDEALASGRIQNTFYVNISKINTELCWLRDWVLRNNKRRFFTPTVNEETLAAVSCCRVLWNKVKCVIRNLRTRPYAEKERQRDHSEPISFTACLEMHYFEKLAEWFTVKTQNLLPPWNFLNFSVIIHKQLPVQDSYARRFMQ